MLQFPNPSWYWDTVTKICVFLFAFVVPILVITLVVSARPVFEPLILLDGEEISGDRFAHIQEDSIDHVEVLKGVSATTFYGEKGRGGAIVVTTKNASSE